MEGLLYIEFNPFLVLGIILLSITLAVVLKYARPYLMILLLNKYKHYSYYKLLKKLKEENKE